MQVLVGVHMEVVLGVGGCGSGYVKYDDGACLLCILILGLIAIL